MPHANKVRKNSTYRFMCERLGNSNYHIDFQTKEESLQYANELDDPKVSWYGVYEVDEVKGTLVRIMHKRLFNTVIMCPKSDSLPANKTQKSKKNN